MNLVDKAANIRRGFADVDINKHRDELLYSLAEKKELEEARITERAGLIRGCTNQEVKRELETEQAMAKLKVRLLRDDISKKTGFPHLLIARCRSALTSEAWETVITLAKQDQARLESQIHIGDDE